MPSFLFYFAKTLYLCGFLALKKNSKKKSQKKFFFLFYLAYYMCQQKGTLISASILIW